MKLAALLTLIIVVTLMSFAAYAHDAPAGWAYDASCCSGYDCSPVSASTVKEGPAGYTLPTGETIAYSDRRIRQSQDEQFHWCTPGGRRSGRTLCLYVPVRGF